MTHDYDHCYAQCLKYIRWYVSAIEDGEDWRWFSAEWDMWNTRREGAKK